jgi:hypothetical protein
MIKVIFFETHRHIGHIVIYKSLIINILYNFYVSYVPMCFKKRTHYFYSLLSFDLP